MCFEQASGIRQQATGVCGANARGKYTIAVLLRVQHRAETAKRETLGAGIETETYISAHRRQT